ncbi:MAG: hypothetical protein WDM79_14910 [Terricaulis sp.]
MRIGRRALMECLLATSALGIGVRSALAQSVQYTYDVAGRLKKAQYSDGSSIEYFYDASGIAHRSCKRPLRPANAFHRHYSNHRRCVG